MLGRLDGLHISSRERSHASSYHEGTVSLPSRCCVNFASDGESLLGYTYILTYPPSCCVCGNTRSGKAHREASRALESAVHHRGDASCSREWIS